MDGLAEVVQETMEPIFDTPLETVDLTEITELLQDLKLQLIQLTGAVEMVDLLLFMLMGVVIGAAIGIVLAVVLK